MSGSSRQPQPPRQAVIIRNGAVLALLVGVIHHLQLPEGLFLVLAVLTVLESSLGGGAIAGRERLLGSLIGLLAVVIASGALQMASQPLQVFSGLTLVRLFGYALGLSSGYVVGGHMVAGSLLHDTSHWWHYAFWRTLMTLIGVMIGVFLSRQIYSHRAISRWESSCNDWLLDLSTALQNLAGSPDPPQVFDHLRERRNSLRQDLPTLAAEHSILEAHNSDSLLRAQNLLQHGSTVMSCIRDLAGLLPDGRSLPPWIDTLALEQLIQAGAALLKQLVDGSSSTETVRRVHQIRSLIEIDVNSHLKRNGEDLGLRHDLLVASRILLLSDGLIQIGQPMNRTGQE